MGMRFSAAQHNGRHIGSVRWHAARTPSSSATTNTVESRGLRTWGAVDDEQGGVDLRCAGDRDRDVLGRFRVTGGAPGEPSITRGRVFMHHIVCSDEFAPGEPSTTSRAASACAAPAIMLGTKSRWPGASSSVTACRAVSKRAVATSTVTPRARSSGLRSLIHTLVFNKWC